MILYSTKLKKTYLNSDGKQESKRNKTKQRERKHVTDARILELVKKHGI